MTTLAPANLSARARRLLSKDRADHPHAKTERCRIQRIHGPHPWGRIVEQDPDGRTWDFSRGSSLAHWCEGRTT